MTDEPQAPPTTLVRKADTEAKQQRRGQPTIGLALGAGAARGWSHIGVLRELAAHDIKPDVIAGTSIGAVVAGCYAAGKLDQIEAFARTLTKRRVFTLMDLSFSGVSLITGERLRSALEKELEGLDIEDLPIPFAAVATQVRHGPRGVAAAWLPVPRHPRILCVAGRFRAGAHRRSLAL